MVETLATNSRGPIASDSDTSEINTDRKRRSKSVKRSISLFVQKVAKQITAVSMLAKSKSAPPHSIVPLLAGEGLGEVPTTGAEQRGAVTENGEGKRPGVIGIHNHGNTCYLNAVLQCLSNTERLLNYFVTNQYKVSSHL